MGSEVARPRRKMTTRHILAWVLSLCSFAWAGSSARGQAPHPPELPVITSAHEVHALTKHLASLGYPVRIRGTVVYCDPSIGDFAAIYVADASGGVFAHTDLRVPLSAKDGDLVEVTGVTDPGTYSPMVAHAQVRVLGTSAAWPKAMRRTLPQLASGQEDAQWVEVEGLVESVDALDTHYLLTLDTEYGKLAATAVKWPGVNYDNLVDSKVLIRGVAGPMLDGKRRMIGSILLTPSSNAVTVLEPAPADPFALPVQTVGELFQYSPWPQTQHRIHLRGRVTLYWPGQTLCFMDEGDGLCMHIASRTPLRLGELIDVTGFLARDGYEPTLVGAKLRPSQDRVPVSATPITADEAFSGKHNGELVQIEGKLIGKNFSSSNMTLLFSTGQQVFQVLLPVGSIEQEQELASQWVEGSSAVVTGVLGKVEVHRNIWAQSIVRLESFHLLLRSSDDIKIVQRPSWWTSQHMFMLLGGMVVLTLVILCWSVLLRRQVAQQTAMIRRSEERFRHLAHHDALTGLPVRTLLMERLESTFVEARKNGTSFALFMLDLDHFKELNDTMGHAAGDEILCVAAQRFEACVRETDTVARIGGDEFMALLPGVNGVEEAAKLAAKFVACFSSPVMTAGHRTSVTVSVGVATYPDSGENAAELLNNADIALYQAKAQGRNGYHVFSFEMAEAGSQKP